MSLDAAIDGLNARLKAGGHRPRVRRKNLRLYLRATLPCRDDPGVRKQHDLALDLAADPAGILTAETEALRLSLQLKQGTFNWSAWSKPSSASSPEAGISVHEFREAARRLYEKRFTTETSWKKKWGPALNKLPPGGLMTEATVLRAVRKMPEGTAGRRDAANILAQVCQSLDIPHAAVQSAGRGYTAAHLTQRDIPEDAEIERLFHQIRLPHWRWVYGMCATYGTRPHELVEAVIDDDGNCVISDDTKTGYHLAWPVHARWLETFELRSLPRPTQGKETLAKVANDYLHDRGPMPWGLYTLRHAYACRLITKGVPADIGCQLMGHSLEIHTRTYRRWLQKEKLAGLRGRFDL